MFRRIVATTATATALMLATASAASANNFSATYYSVTASWIDGSNTLSISGPGYGQLRRPGGSIETVSGSRSFGGIQEDAYIEIRACAESGCSGWAGGTS